VRGRSHAGAGGALAPARALGLKLRCRILSWRRHDGPALPGRASAPRSADRARVRCHASADGRWTFRADQPLAFNVHYHVGKDVIYAAQDDRVREQDGYLEVADDQDYCWMWSNDGKLPANLKTALERG